MKRTFLGLILNAMVAAIAHATAPATVPPKGADPIYAELMEMARVNQMDASFIGLTHYKDSTVAVFHCQFYTVYDGDGNAITKNSFNIGLRDLLARIQNKKKLQRPVDEEQRALRAFIADMMIHKLQH